MRNKKDQILPVALRSVLISTFGLFLTGLIPVSSPQSQPSLQINSPLDGTVVSPGQTITVSVTSPSGAAFSQLAVIGENPLPLSNVATSLPSQFSILLPTSLALRKYQLTAVGLTPSGQTLDSLPISVDVERSDLPTAIAVNRAQLAFQCQGQQTRLRVMATFSDGSMLDVTESTNVTYVSANASIATVNSTGIVTALGAGSTSLIAQYSQGTSRLTATVSVSVPPPVLSSAPTSLTFGSQPVGTNSSSQSLTLTNVSKNQGLTISSVSATGDFSETDNCVSVSPLPVGNSCAINVTFGPTSSGARAGTINVSNSFTVVPVAVPVSGMGLAQPGTTTTIASSANPSVSGQVVVLTSAVTPLAGSGAPTGSVTFSDGTSAIGAAPLSSGQATLTTSSLTVGPHPITAAYSGDANFTSSTSPVLSQVVNQASTATTLTSSANPSTLNGSISLAANLTVVSPGAGTPTGSIAFQDGSTTLATVPVSASGQATYSTASLSIGSHSLTASYSGDANFKSSSGTLTEHVSYSICVLYDQTKSVHSGATFPVKLFLCDSNGNDVSSSSIVLHATGVTSVSGFSGPVESAGNANPDNDFRFDGTLGPTGGYIFNLKTSGLASGTYSLQFNAGSDSVTHAVLFGVK